MMGENDDVPHKIAIEMVMVNRYFPQWHIIDVFKMIKMAITQGVHPPFFRHDWPSPSRFEVANVSFATWKWLRGAQGRLDGRIGWWENGKTMENFAEIPKNSWFPVKILVEQATIFHWKWERACFVV